MYNTDENILKSIINDYILKYNLLGIGEFSHGIQESWSLRFDILKYAINNTNNHIIIFNEMSDWQANNIMNNTITIWNNDKKKYVSYNGIREEIPNITPSGFSYLWQYVYSASESIIFYEIIEYIRANKNRIKIIGVDNEKIDRDHHMYRIIMNNIDKKCINFFWAHNAHISNMKLDGYNLDYIENKTHQWYCGHYLRKELGTKYCIILTQAYCGTNRFNSHCIGRNCKKRYFTNYFYLFFVHEPHYKFIKKMQKNKQKIFKKSYFGNKFISFSNSYFDDNKYGYSSIYEYDDYDNIIFWDKVHYLVPYTGRNLIIHISGPSGSGKTTIGNILSQKYGDKICVADMDDIIYAFITETYKNSFSWKKFDSELYQTYINDFISKNIYDKVSGKIRIIIFTGLNHMPWHNKILYYNLHATYKFYIKIKDIDVVQQKCIRFLTKHIQDFAKDPKTLIDIRKNNDKFVNNMKNAIEGECGTKETYKLNKMWNHDYKKQGYTFLAQKDIISIVSDLIDKFFVAN